MSLLIDNMGEAEEKYLTGVYIQLIHCDRRPKNYLKFTGSLAVQTSKLLF
jgi:hypothetical protein